MVWSASPGQLESLILISTFFAEILQKGKEGKEARGKKTYLLQIKLDLTSVQMYQEMSISSTEKFHKNLW